MAKVTMRLVLGLAAAASFIAATPTADACSAPACWPGTMTPSSATPVPKNLPGIFWKPQASYNPGEADDPSLVVLANAADPSTPLPFTATARGDGTFVLVPTNPLVEGATYTVTDNNTCDFGGGGGQMATFQAGPEAELPTASGTLLVQSESHSMIDVATASGSCSAEVFAHRVDLKMDMASAALPWAGTLHYDTYVDGALWSRTTSINVQAGVGGTWRLYRVCESTDPYLESSGLSAGVHEVAVKATIPGTAIELWTEPLRVVMACPGEGVDVNGDGDGDDEVGGCNASGGSSAWLLFALVGLYSASRKRQR